jgi:hypothetical protein
MVASMIGGRRRGVGAVPPVGACFWAFALPACFSSSNGTAPDASAQVADGAPTTDGAGTDRQMADVTSASHDGSTSPDGSGGPLADGGTAADAGAPVVLFPYPGTYSLAGVSVDNAYVYWSGNIPPGTVNGAAIFRVSKGGGTPAIVYNVAGAVGPTAVDDTAVYFGSGSQVLKAAKDGSTDAGAAQVLLDLGLGLSAGFVDIAIDRANVYVPAGGSLASQTGNGIVSVPLGGGPKTTVVDGLGPSPVDPVVGQSIQHPGINGLVSDGTNVFYTVYDTYGGGLSATSPLAYSGWILSVPVGGGAQAIVAPDQKDAGSGVAYASNLSGRPSVAGGFVYWTNYGYVFKGSAGSSTPTTLVANPTSGSGMSVTDGTNVYYLNGISYDVMKVSVNGGTPVLLQASGNYGFGATMAMDDTSIYVSAGGNKTIVKIPK